jgi:hypothetical protein
MMTTSRVDPPSRIAVAWAAALVLSLAAFVLAAGEAWAAEQPPQTAQQGTVETKTMINGQVAEPVSGTTMPVDTQLVEKPPVEDTAPSPPKNEAPPAEEPSPPPVDAAPSASGPDPAPLPAPQWFAMVIIDGKVVEPDPVLTTPRPVADPGQVLEQGAMSNASPDVVDPAPAPAAPAAAAGADDWHASGPAPDQVLPVPGAVSPAASPREHTGSPPPTPANTGLTEGVKRLGMGPSVPASVGGALPLPSSLGATAASAVGTVRSAAASAASATAEVLGALAGGSPGTSYDNSADGNRGQPPEGTPQPAPPVAPPGGGSSFSPSAGGGQMGTGGGFAPLLVGILALLAVILLGRDFRTYLVSCEVPKPSSALLQPLERPG